MAAGPEHVPNIDVHEVEDGLVVYDLTADRVHYLNVTAALVFELCTGANSDDEIVELVRLAWHLEAPPDDEVRTCLKQLRDEGVIQ